ncbi:MAG TPA: MFS transporter [Xanthobacteraceae bacterium]|nr:MFS transporter [Xanthobacteraceae bacterium]
MSTVNAGARLDRLPISSFHYRIFWLIGAGMFFDGYDLYVGTTVLGAALQSGFSTLAKNAQFVSLTFLGMTIGSFVAGFLGDHYGRRFTYQFNLLVFGVASLAAAVAPTMETLNLVRFVIGLGLGAEIVVGYSTLTEFVPPRVRGRWLALMAFIVVSGLPVTVLLGTLIIPSVSTWGAAAAKESSGYLAILLPGLGWRLMFVIAGIGAFVVWYLRKALPESPRWLESKGRNAEAEALIKAIEREAASAGPLPAPTPAAPAPAWSLASLAGPTILPRMVVGCVTLISINTLIFGFVLWLPQFFIQQGLSIARSFAFTLVISLGSIAGCAVGAFTADRLGRRRSIIGASVLTIVFGSIYPFVSAPALLLTTGVLLVISIYVQVSILFGVYTPELFPTEIRLRANGICNTVGRAATVVSPFIVIALFKSYGVGGVLGLMTALLLVQIGVVYAWGIEPNQRPLEEMEVETPGAGAAPRTAQA